MTRHIHHDLIVQWVTDTTQVVEYRESFEGGWRKTINPQWDIRFEYRIRHKHQDLIDRKKKRPELVVEFMCDEKWLSIVGPNWDSMYEYRLVEPRHKHQDLIDQKAARPELIVLCSSTGHKAWVRLNNSNPDWNPDLHYRLVKPVAKKKVKMWQWVFQTTSGKYFIPSDFFQSALEANTYWNTHKAIQRADWTEIEVDE